MDNFKKTISELRLPPALETQLLEDWESQVAANREAVAKEIREENEAYMQEELNKMAEAAETLADESIKAFLEGFDSKVSKLNEAKIKLAKMAKALRESRESATEREQKLAEQLAQLSAEALKSQLAEQQEALSESHAATEAERVKLMRENMRLSKQNKNHIDAFNKLATSVLKDQVAELHESREELKNELHSEIEALASLVESTVKAEMDELNEDRVQMMEAVEKLTDMNVGILTKELVELNEDRVELAQTKERVIAESKAELEATKKEWIKTTGKKVEELVESVLYPELNSLKTELKEARKNDFAMRIFEAFAGQYSSIFFNENVEVSKLMKQLKESNENVQKMQQILSEKDSEVNNVKKELRESQQKTYREGKITELTKSLSGVHKEIMTQLLESTQTDKLEATFKRNLPQVLNEDVEAKKPVEAEKPVQPKKRLTESVDGSRKQHAPIQQNSGKVELDGEIDISHIFKHAGLK